MTVNNMILNLILLLFLAAGSFIDVRIKKIPLWLVAVFGLILVPAGLIADGRNILNIFLGMLTGCLVIALALISKGAVGLGDGLVFAVTGIAYGWRSNILLIILSFAFAALCSVFFLVIKKKKMNRGQKVPFIPEILAAHILMMIM